MKNLFCYVLVISLLLSPGASIAQVRSAAYTSDTADAEWTKDMDKKLDTAITVLKVLKDELKEEEEEKAKTPAKTVSATAPADKQIDEQISVLGDFLKRAVRVWKKIRKATAPEAGDTSAAKKQDEEMRELTSDLKKKLDTTISAMQAIQKELDDLEKEEAK